MTALPDEVRGALGAIVRGFAESAHWSALAQPVIGECAECGGTGWYGDNACDTCDLADGEYPPEPEPVDSYSLASGEIRRMGLLVLRWLRTHGELAARGLERYSRDSRSGQWEEGELFGHDLALSCQRHGTGFWDRAVLDVCDTCGGLLDGRGRKRSCPGCGLDAGPPVSLGESLSEASHELPEELGAWIDASDDGQVVRFDGLREIGER